MSRWGNNKDQEEETVNFEALLSDNINAVALMETEHFLEKVKNNSANFTQMYHPQYAELYCQVIGALSTRLSISHSIPIYTEIGTNVQSIRH